jgi:hypothetical protein
MIGPIPVVGAAHVLFDRKANNVAGNDNSKSLVMLQSGSYESSRLNALRHGVLSKYSVLTWEDEKEYRTLLGAVVAEHHPNGQTEHYLVEELAGIMWRKRHLRLAEIALHQNALKRVTDDFLQGVEGALGRITPNHPHPFAALSNASEQEHARCLADVEAYRAQVLKALRLLKGSSYEAYKRGLAALHGHTREWWERQRHFRQRNERVPGPSFSETAESLHEFLETKVLPWCDRCRQLLGDRSTINAKAFGEAVSHDGIEKLARYEISLDRKFERTLAMLLKFQDLRRANPSLPGPIDPEPA